MADFDLTQTDAQVQSILNDAQNAQGAGAQTTLTTDYIMLKDTSGNYHKILKDSFTEACRNVLAGLLVNNDKGTTISQIPAIASGDFGSVTPANLASVLGGVITTLKYSGDDLNNRTATGKYFTNMDSSKLSNMPPTGQSVTRAVVVVENRVGIGSSTFISQTFYEMYVSQIWYRTCNDSTWSSWQRIDNYGTSSLSELASALGAFITKVTVNNFGDLTDLNFEPGTGPGLYWSICAPSSAPANLPSAISTSTRFMLVYLYTAYDRYQIVIDRSSNTPYGRYGVGNPGSVSWSSWKEL